MRIVDPVSQPVSDDRGVAPRVDTLSGKALGFISNGWRSFDAIADQYSKVALEKYEVSEVVYRKNPSAASATPKDAIEELVSRTDAAVVGIGH